MNNKSCTIADNIKSHSTITRSILFENRNCAKASELEKMLLRQTLKHRQVSRWLQLHCIYVCRIPSHNKQPENIEQQPDSQDKINLSRVYVNRGTIIVTKYSSDKLYVWVNQGIQQTLRFAKLLNPLHNLSILKFTIVSEYITSMHFSIKACV